MSVAETNVCVARFREPLYLRIKRAFDLSVAIVLLVFASPLLLAIAVLVSVSSRGGVIYRANRVGLRGEPFTMFKFRTMVANADQMGGPITAPDDTRVTPLGRWLRRTKLDELPELWNVIRGDMSLVGPRPENPKSVSLYTVGQRAVLRIRPGVTSPATIKYRHEESMLHDAGALEEAYFVIMQDKLALELQYLRNRTFLNDLKILLQTVSALRR
jgi:lipopolysaccharide/colanic/teichoic acid biosynthesis glycosyltransferase